MICIGFGRAVGKTVAGPCAGAKIGEDEAVKLQEEAIEKAYEDAKKKCECPAGCKLEGELVFGEPHCQEVNNKNGPEHFFIIMVTFYGECKCDSKPAQVAKGHREFFRWVRQLKELPKNPQGQCQMYKKDSGHGFPIPVCAGDCGPKKCKGANVSFNGEEFTISACDCV